MKQQVVALVLLQAGWFACVCGAAAGRPALGIAVVAAIAAASVRGSSSASRKLILLATAGLAGYVADSLLVIAGWMEFPPQAGLGWPSTAWMTALWVNLAAALRVFPAFLRENPLTAGAAGALGGPLAYLAGESLGALSLQSLRSVALVGAEWALALPLLFALDRKLQTAERLREAAA